MWPKHDDFDDWHPDVYDNTTPGSSPESAFAWSRTATRTLDGVTEQVVEWRFTLHPPDSELAFDRLDEQEAA